MATCELHIDLEREERNYTAGEQVKGSVQVLADEVVQCKALTMELLWQTHGKGNTTSGGKQKQELFSGEILKGESRRFPFSFTLPDGPLTYYGHYLNVSWYLRARADIPWSLDPKAEEEIALEADPEREPNWQALYQSPYQIPSWLRKDESGGKEPLKGSFGWFARAKERSEQSRRQSGAKTVRLSPLAGIGCLVAFLLLFGAGFAIPVMRLVNTVREGGLTLQRDFPYLIAGAFILSIIGVVVIKTLKNKMASRKLGEVTLDVSSRRFRRGQEVRANLFFTPRAVTDLERALLHLEAEERVVRGSGTNRRTYRRRVYQEEVEMSPGRQLPAGVPTQLQGRTRIPAGASPSFMATNNQLTWRVTAVAEIDRWPDWKDYQEIAVYP